MHFRQQCLAAATIVALAISFAPSFAQESASQDHAAEAINQHRLIQSLRDIEAMARELYYDQSFILLYLHGNRTEWIGSRNIPSRLLTEAVESRFVPPLKRFSRRIDQLDLSESQKKLLGDAMASLNLAIEAGYDIAEKIDRDGLAEATTIFHEQSLPAFKSTWRDFYTVISELERDYPRL